MTFEYEAIEGEIPERWLRGFKAVHDTAFPGSFEGMLTIATRRDALTILLKSMAVTAKPLWARVTDLKPDPQPRTRARPDVPTPRASKRVDSPATEGSKPPAIALWWRASKVS